MSNSNDVPASVKRKLLRRMIKFERSGLQSAKSGAGEQFLPLAYRAKARPNGVFIFTHTHTHTRTGMSWKVLAREAPWP